MNRLARILFTVLLLAASLAAGYGSRYEIRYLGPHAAQTLGWDQCAAEKVTDCSVRVFTEQGEKAVKTILEVFAPREVHENISRALLRQDAGPETQTFYVVLLAASPKPSGTPANLSPAANKALQDLQGFLPYRGYQVLDTALLRGTREMTGRLVGPEGVGYRLELWFQQPGGPESKSLYVQSFQLAEEGPVPVGAATANGKRDARPPRQLIRTSFTTQKGETLVVGTSRLDGGDDALVLLLTASPPTP
jgi:hypothetical protein